MANEDKKKKLPEFTSTRGIFVFPKLTEPDYGNDKFPKPDGEFSTKLRMSQDDAEAMLDMKNKQGDTIRKLYEAALAEAEVAFKALDVGTRKKFEQKGVTGPVANAIYNVIYDKETEEPTGEVEFKVAMKHSGEFKKGPKAGKVWCRYPVLFDARGVKIKGTIARDKNGNVTKDRAGDPVYKYPNIWGGSEGKLSFAVSNYFIPGTAAAGIKLMLGAAQIIELVSNGSRSADSYGFGEEDGYGYEPDQEQTSDETDTGTSGDTGSAGSDVGNDDF